MCWLRGWLQEPWWWSGGVLQSSPEAVLFCHRVGLTSVHCASSRGWLGWKAWHWLCWQRWLTGRRLRTGWSSRGCLLYILGHIWGTFMLISVVLMDVLFQSTEQRPGTGRPFRDRRAALRSGWNGGSGVSWVCVYSGRGLGDRLPLEATLTAFAGQLWPWNIILTLLLIFSQRPPSTYPDEHFTEEAPRPEHRCLQNRLLA